MNTDFLPEQIVCISHPDSGGRLEQMHTRFKAHKMKVTLSPGVDPLPGEERYVACLRAHQNAVKHGKDLNVPHLLVFEDDVVFLKEWSWVKRQLADVPENFDIVRLCLITDGTYYRQHIRGHVFRCWRAYGTQCYLINSTCFDTILDFPPSDPYDDQLSDANLVQYAVHPLPYYHEIGTSLLGNSWMQTRDDLSANDMSRAQAAESVDEVLAGHIAPYTTQLRIIQALSLLRDRPHTQELRFLRQVLETVPMTRDRAREIAHAMFILSVQNSAPAES